MPYHVLINEATFGKAADYLDKLKGNPSLAGKYLRVALQGVDLSRLSVRCEPWSAKHGVSRPR
ncbi:hypothetical protein ACGP04_07740 [Piscirickettsia salmonis]|uniref:hypothetical protein n=1 Tax=Piscirickettsia salmonis TaxID=1238 RepID=UPI000F0959D6|nr:hypothetical protein DA717_12245 [Piscirickettsiaceae bacterium NZ-RLO2]